MSKTKKRNQGDQITQILSLTKQTVKRTYARLTGIVLLKVVLMAALSIAGSALIFNNLADTPVEQIIRQVAGSHGMIIGIAVLAVITLILFLMEVAAMLTVIVKNVSFRESIKFCLIGWYRILPLTIVFCVLIAGAFIIPGLAMFIIGSLILSPGFLEAWFLAIGIAIVSLICSAIVSTRLAFVYFVWAENQGKKISLILKESFALTKGKMFFLLILLIIIFGAINGAINNAVTILFGEETLGTTISVVLGALLTAVYWCASYATYESAKKVKKIKEGS